MQWGSRLHFCGSYLFGSLAIQQLLDFWSSVIQKLSDSGCQRFKIHSFQILIGGVLSQRMGRALPWRRTGIQNPSRSPWLNQTNSLWHWNTELLNYLTGRKEPQELLKSLLTRSSMRRQDWVLKPELALTFEEAVADVTETTGTLAARRKWSASCSFFGFFSVLLGVRLLEWPCRHRDRSSRLWMLSRPWQDGFQTQVGLWCVSQFLCYSLA